MAEMNSWDICRMFVTLRENLFRLKNELSQYAYEDAVVALGEIERKVYVVELDVEAYFAPDWDECKKLQRAETPVQRETENPAR